MTEPQTYWKKIKVPPPLLEAGWKLIKRDTSAPFALVNEKLDQDTGGFPDPQEAIAAAQALTVELEEAAAIASEGQLTNGERPTVLPVQLVDEGWRLQYRKGGKPPRPIFAERGELRTESHADVADTVAEAIKLERERQEEIERRELGHAAIAAQSDVDAGLESFVARGQAAQKAVDELLPGNGDHATPARLALERIRTDGGTQQRSLFDQAVLDDYAEIMQAGDEFPAVDVFFDGAEYWLADGFYRLEARRKLGQNAIGAHVRQGSQRDAILFSLGANARHGLPRTPEDKRRAVLVMLRDPEWASWSDAVIAERVRVSVPLVRKLRHQVDEETTDHGEAVSGETKPTKRRGRDGRVVDTSKIGKRAQGGRSADPQLALEPARPTLCEGCNVEIGANDYRNEAGLCWDCAGKGKKKSSRAASTESEKSATAAPLETPRPTLAELSQGRSLKISLYMLANHPGRAFVSVTATPSTLRARGFSGDLELAADDLSLPPSLLELVRIALEASTRKPARKATKKAAAQVLKKAVRKAITKKEAAAIVRRLQRKPASKSSKATRKPGKTVPASPRRKPAARKGKPRTKK
jgi:hypothetical protein